ncbi:PHP domain-containing protein [Streptococcus merionis]|uniref:PHP domain-containing protein n=1 Tax=Streptococcus merionis TaxID=400065 RepID=UPI0026F2F940|nr:PHP domain-containing protein [Streptococcus merionis]
MRDNHLHTNFSYDATANFSEYLDHYSGEIVTTEHLDLSNPYPDPSHLTDDVPDYERYCREIAELEAIYGPRIKRGIEIGYYAPREADLLAYLADKDYDLKLLSVHHNGQYDYLDPYMKAQPAHSVIPAYLDQLETAIGRVEADVLAHFDYGFRVFELTVEDLQVYEAQLLRIFQKMIDHKLAFELNSKSMYLYGHEHLYRYALTLICSLGGSRISIGSDGHKLEHFRLAFDKIEALLEEFGIGEEAILK